MNYRAFRVHVNDKEITRGIETLDMSSLPEGDVLIAVHYSSLNYKDALSANGNRGVSKNYPHTPGIDAAGIVEKSTSPHFKSGDRVIVTGYNLGMNVDGGLAEYISVPESWVVNCPDNLSLKDAMIYGTAGFTAALSVNKIVENVDTDQGEILVTGSTGGVGSIAIAILAKLGYHVLATTGKMQHADYLHQLGAEKILTREDVLDESGRPLLKPKWASSIDTVGGETLNSVIKATAYGGHVTTCGNVGGASFETSVYPFILNGVTLHGIDSVNCNMSTRQTVWSHLSSDWSVPKLLNAYNEITLDEVEASIQALLDGTHKGRTIVKIKA